jgi:hypothetical protein
MFQRLKSVEHSPILNFVKSKKKSITALSLASLSAATLAITTGIAPVRVAGVSNVEKAQAADKILAQGAFGCGYFKLQQAWWGAYMYLNKCAADQMVAQSGITLPAAAAISTWIPGIYGKVVSTAVIYNGAIAGGLSYCSANYNQAYLKFQVVPGPLPPFGLIVVPYVSCT